MVSSVGRVCNVFNEMEKSTIKLLGDIRQIYTDYKSSFDSDDNSKHMGICEDVSPGACDFIFVLFLIEMSFFGLALFCVCIIPCFALCNQAVKEANKTPEEIEKQRASVQKIRDDARALVHHYDRVRDHHI